MTPEPVAQAQTPAQPAAATSEAGAAGKQAAANEVAQAVGSWAAAWSSQDVDAYLSYYAPDFRPGRGLSRSAWVEQRRDRVTRPAFIQVNIADLFVDVRGPDSARAVFKQDYSATGYQDSVIKTLTLRRIDGDWKITREVSRAP